LGIWLAMQLWKPKASPAGKLPRHGFQPDAETIHRYGISPRERDVLELMAAGCSNAEIAARLFVSANTVKTHVSRIFGKLEVRRRTQAVDRARQIGLIA
jgi:ATP/maltotriose-dependent transcriptional regulator MalT